MSWSTIAIMYTCCFIAIIASILFYYRFVCILFIHVYMHTFSDQLDSAESFLRLAVTEFPEVEQFHSSLGIVLGKRGKYNVSIWNHCLYRHTSQSVIYGLIIHCVKFIIINHTWVV